MYLLDTQVTIKWVVLPSELVIPRSDLDVIITKPDRSSVYLAGAISVDDYLPQTESVNGSVIYRITPEVKGLWQISLVVGSQNNYQVLSIVDMFVFGRAASTPKYRAIPAPSAAVLIAGAFILN